MTSIKNCKRITANESSMYSWINGQNTNIYVIIKIHIVIYSFDLVQFSVNLIALSMGIKILFDIKT